MGGSDKYRGDFVWVRNGVSQTKITPSVYRYLAMKINVASPLSADLMLTDVSSWNYG